MRTLAALVPLCARERGIRRGRRSHARHGEHRVAADQQRTRADDDAPRAGPVLRRPGAGEEHAVAVHAVPGCGRRSGRALDRGGLQGRLRRRAGPSSATSPSSASPGSTSKPWRPTASPNTLFVMFQAMFAIITPALMIGAFAERMRFGPYLAFITLWLLVVYCPLAHMVWGGGWIRAMGAKDFAGGMVVHMSSGYSALVAALFLGKRRGFGKEPMPPHNLPLAVIGASPRWVGWFGFNAGSELWPTQRGAGVPDYEHSRLDGARHLDGDRVAPPRQAYRAGGGHGARGRAGGDHAGLRLRDADGLDRGRHRRVGAVLRRGHLPEADVRLRRLARRVRRTRHRRHLGRARDRALHRAVGVARRGEPRRTDRDAAEEHRVHGDLRTARNYPHPARAARGLRLAAPRRGVGVLGVDLAEHSETAYMFGSASGSPATQLARRRRGRRSPPRQGSA